MVNASWGNPRNQAILESLWTYGLRENELKNLKLKNINIDEKPYPIDINVSKSTARTTPTRHDIPHIINWVSQHPDYKNRNISELPLFPSGHYGHRLQHMATRSIWDIIKKASKKAGITRNITVHMFRHTSITNFFREGGTLQEAIEIFGANAKTLQIYIHLSKEDICNKFKKSMITKEPSPKELKKENSKINKLEQELIANKKRTRKLEEELSILIKYVKNQEIKNKLGIIDLKEPEGKRTYNY
jgi:site-specific recombinase XerD